MSGTTLTILALIGWFALIGGLWALVRGSARRDSAQEEALDEWRRAGL